MMIEGECFYSVMNKPFYATSGGFSIQADKAVSKNHPAHENK